MKIAAILNVHNQPELAKDTIDSLRVWVTDKILLVVDGGGWKQYEHFSHPNTTVRRGEVHNSKRHPYRNVSKGLKWAYDLWPDMDWYFYLEFDVLVLNDHFKEDLSIAMAEKISALGMEFRPKGKDTNNHWLVKEIFEKPELECYKMLGAVMFYSNYCIKSWNDCSFFEKILSHTKDYKPGHFPDFNEMSVDEFIFPTAAAIFGELRCLNNFKRYTVKWGNDLKPQDINASTSIVHPVKKYENQIRDYYRKARKVFL